MTHNAALALFFLLAVPGQTIGGQKVPDRPGVYPRPGGKTLLVGERPADLPARLSAEMGRYPRDLVTVLVPVGPEDRDVRLSAHYVLGDFMCKGDDHVVTIRPRLVAKLEALMNELHREGYRCTKLRVLSGYRTPAYNREIGNETTHSLHLQGEAADLIVQDFDGDGKIDARDALILFHAVSVLDRNPEFTGGAGVYAPTADHGWFVHTDVRGKLVRWGWTLSHRTS